MPTHKDMLYSEKYYDNKLMSRQLVRPTDENAVLVTLKNVGSESPDEPAPPKLSYNTRNGLRQLRDLKTLNIEPPLKPDDLGKPKKLTAPLKDSAPLKDIVQPVNQQQQAPQPQQINLAKPTNEQAAKSRIPRLSLKLSATATAAATAKPLPTDGRGDHLARNAASTKQLLAAVAERAACESDDDDEADLSDEDDEIENIDKSPSRDAIFQVCDVAKDIYEYMYSLEEKQSVREDFLKDQKIYTPKIRQRLINWCIDIHSQLKLLPETLYMTIAVIDRYFNKISVQQQSQVQLVAVGSTLIASKYEEIYPPDVGDLIHLTQNSYTRREVIGVEINILQELNFDLGRPIPLAFLRRFSKAAHCDLKMHSIAKYLMELSLTEYECSHWRPSLLAAAALFTTIHLVHSSALTSDTFGATASRILRPFAQNLTNVQPSTYQQQQLQQQQQPTSRANDRWTKTLVHYTHYTRRQLQEPAGILCKILKRSQKSPQSFACVRKNLQNISKWPELKSTRVDELIKLGDQQHS